ncbi:MAG TPA: pyruvate kinase [Methylomirabilota bacterium]|nr:pyruvate kinase [Methylomirabilota bacterium]
MNKIPGIERRTKIVCTIGPATSSPAQLRALLEGGMNVARLNFSHGEPAEHRAVLAQIRALSKELGIPTAVLQDLAGPKVRIGTLAHGSVELEAGRRFTLTTRPVEGSRDRVSVSYAGLPAAVKVGDTLLLADGVIHLRVERVTAEDIHCQVVVGGRLGSRKGVNVPSGLPDLPILSDKDLGDLRVGLEQGIDYLGLSFVRWAEDVRTARAHIECLGGQVPVIAKIETQAALDHFDEILDTADGIMIARGDLSIETPFARVPIVQKHLIAEANRRAKPVITATQMLFSMVSAPQPTRAEVADVANAVLDGSDAVMLSEETAIGRHPVRAVQVMAAIALETERGALQGPRPPGAPAELPRSDEEAVVQAACQLAAHRSVDVVVTVTRTGETARFAAKHRPAQPIVALTGDPEICRRLAVVRGVLPLVVPASSQDPEEMIAAARRAARERGWSGMRAVVVAHDRLWTGRL